MTNVAEQITKRCAEARDAIANAWSVADLSRALLLVSQVEVLALMAAGVQLLPDTEAD